MEVNKFVTMCLWALNFGAGEHVQKGWVVLPQSLDCDFRLIWYGEQKFFVFIKVKITRKRVFMRSFIVDICFYICPVFLPENKFETLLIHRYYYLVCPHWERWKTLTGNNVSSTMCPSFRSGYCLFDIFLSSPQQRKVFVYPGISDATMGSVFITGMNVMVTDSAMTGATNGIVVCIYNYDYKTRLPT